MSRTIVATCIAAGLLASAPVSGHGYEKGDLRVGHPWTRATPPGAKVAAGYLSIRNSGQQPDRILGASSPAAERVELHIQVRNGSVVKMREVQSVEVPPGRSRMLRPGSVHLMLVNLRKPLVRGQRVPLTLRFERAGEVQVELEVQAADTAGQAHH